MWGLSVWWIPMACLLRWMAVSTVSAVIPSAAARPDGARVTVRILGINQETNRIWGAITHIAAAR